jgi:hypothetical protein
MKKLLVSALLIAGLVSAQPAKAGISLGLDVALPYGVGLGLGYGFSITPLLEVGAEWSTNSFSGNLPSGVSGVDVNASISGQRYGIFGKLNLPVFPVKIHAGLHNGSLNAATAVKLAGATQASSSGSITGSYVDIGLEYKIAMFFIEPRLGFQSISINGTTLDLPGLSDLGLRVGVAF